MKKVKRRASATALIAILVAAGLAFYIFRLAQNGGDWATYFSGAAPAGTIMDRNGVVLYTSDGETYSFAENWATRVSCYHLIGDTRGNVRTGALRQFRGDLTGYSFITGTSSGKTLELTVDAALNEAALSALAGRNGAVMLMNYENGELLCMVSAPYDDPANLSSAPADGTYLNKALSSALIPGSVFKLVTIAAAIENIPDLYERKFYCSGSTEINGGELNCSGTHGEQTIEQALANSCNCAFGALAQELGADTLAKYAEIAGLTSEHEVDGMTTAAGSFTKAAEGSLDLAWSGIGQYEDLINPLALLRYVSAIANGGETYEPTLKGHGILERKTRLLSEDTADKIAALMDYNVEYSYGELTFPGLDVSAKTGTAETGDGTSHAWMTGFLNDPEHPYAFVVVVENAGSGIRNAAPVANAVLQAAVK